MNLLKLSFSTGFLLLSIVNVTAQKVYADDNNIANNGYDVVNYFTTNSAQRGSDQFKADHKGTTYYFVDAQNLAAFKNAPATYLPQFDGYCAFGVAKAKMRVPSDPNTFRIDDGKLYLFYNDFWEGKPFNTIVPWLNDESNLERTANANWKEIKDN